MQISALTANGPAAIVRGQKLIRIPATLDLLRYRDGQPGKSQGLLETALVVKPG